ncbi:hypothetical protein [uncultured Thalassolituus sp.]|uniref:hypothetical protein n=1 Tax=uncultured Thalassolituus sp. TaxID=285273 RepID=UPI00262ACE8A|nr:hypothetical protein [uncultured Thalassolituus sp.]
MSKPRETREQAVFFQISSEKLIELSLATFGLFGIYWIWRHWHQLAYRGERLSPALRTLIFPVTQLDLYRRVWNGVDADDERPRWHPMRFFILHLLFTLLPIYMIATDHAWGALTFMLTLLPNLLVNQTVNRIHDRHLRSFARNSDLDAVEWTILVAGLVAWLTLLAYGLQS